ncbi:LPS assembly lipoprotein LptE [Yoonia sp.]|uniref:LPS assembly lipoprotein LptE n=1 Tax=Yoonia sp. TaxID=2212373 RepID=UPI0025FC8699|nr:LPS assembly lipoprotein LptE [Yoonia sp.]
MSSDRIFRRAAILGLLALGGCGFVPVYGNGGGLRGQIDFATPDSVAGFRLRERLEQRLGLPTETRYRLVVTLGEQRTPAAINPAGDTTRFNVIGRASWVLTDMADGVQAGAGVVETFTSYSATGSTVATQAAATDATARLSVALADMIVGRVLILSAGLAQ